MTWRTPPMSVLPEIFNRPLSQLFTESALDVPVVQVGRYVLMMNESADLVKPAKTGTSIEAQMTQSAETPQMATVSEKA